MRGSADRNLKMMFMLKLKILVKIRNRDNTPLNSRRRGGGKRNISNLKLLGVDEVSIGRSIFINDIAKNIEKIS